MMYRLGGQSPKGGPARPGGAGSGENAVLLAGLADPVWGGLLSVGDLQRLPPLAIRPDQDGDPILLERPRPDGVPHVGAYLGLAGERES